MVHFPLPLVPPNLDLQDFPFIPVDVQRLLKSETWILAGGDERAAAISLWLQSWHQVPAGSLPDDDRMLAHLSGCGTRWRKVRAHALRGWVVCVDGRLYHPVVCEKALEAWIEKLANGMAGANGNSKRWGVAVDVSGLRKQLQDAVEMLRSLAPQSRTLKKKIVAVVMADAQPQDSGDGGGSLGDGQEGDFHHGGGSPPDRTQIAARSPEDRKGQGQGQGQGLKEKGARNSGQPFAPALACEAEPPDKDQSRLQALATQAAEGMRAAGLSDAYAEDPELLALLRQGVAPAELVDAAGVGVERKKGKGWVLARVVGRRIDAAQQSDLPTQAAAVVVVPSTETAEQYAHRMAAEREADAKRVLASAEAVAAARQRVGLGRKPGASAGGAS